MRDSLQPVVVVLGLIFGLLVLPAVISKIWYLYHPRKPRGVRFGQVAATWAESRFPVELRPIAAFVADLLCEHLGIGHSQLEPQTRFIDDLKMTDLEPIEFVMALEEELGIDIPDEEIEVIPTILELVQYLDVRLRSSQKTINTEARGQG